MPLTCETAFIHTEPMRRLASAFNLTEFIPPILLHLHKGWHTPAYFIDHFDELLARFPDIALWSIPFFIGKLNQHPRWIDAHHAFEIMADVVDGRFEASDIETCDYGAHLDEAALLQAAFLVATWLDRIDVVEGILGTNVRDLSLTGAVVTGNHTIVQLHFRDGLSRFKCTRGTIMAAFQRGDEDLADRLISRDIQNNYSPDADLLYAATNIGRIEFLSRLFDERFFGDYSTASTAAAASGRIDVLELLHNKQPQMTWSLEVIEEAARHGQLEVARWLAKRGNVESSEEAMEHAARTGNVAMMRLLHKKRLSEVSLAAAAAAAAAGHIDALEWLANKGIAEFGSDVLDGAASNGHLATLEWLAARTRRKCTQDGISRAVEGGYKDVVVWLSKHQRHAIHDNAVDVVVENGHTEMAEYLLSIGVKCSKTAIVRAASRGHLDIVKGLMRHMPDHDWVAVCDAAWNAGRYKIVQWIEQETARLEQIQTTEVSQSMAATHAAKRARVRETTATAE
nr:hypothetical protein HK105_002361 [Polyrhizophydium stewartii]